MQNGKRPTREQRKILNANNYDANDWLYIKTGNKNTTLIFKHRVTGEVIELQAE